MDNLITSAVNEKIKLIRKLSEKKYRREYKLYIAEGITLAGSVTEGTEVHSIYVRSDARVKGEEMAREYGCPYYIVEDKVFDSAADTVTPSGILALIKLPEREIAPPKGNALILDGISDPGNLGTIIRTAAACMYNDIYLIGCTDPYAGKVVRSSMSGIFKVRIYETDYQALSLLKNVTLYALDMGGESIFEINRSYPIAIVIGSEAHGVAEEIRKRADKIVSLPMPGGVESLNAAVAAGISMYLLGGIR
jgi:TrmH family RNA methyltransferase